MMKKGRKAIPELRSNIKNYIKSNGKQLTAEEAKVYEALILHGVPGGMLNKDGVKEAPYLYCKGK